MHRAFSLGLLSILHAPAFALATPARLPGPSPVSSSGPVLRCPLPILPTTPADLEETKEVEPPEKERTEQRTEPQKERPQNR